jgi:hypothetical protein
MATRLFYILLVGAIILLVVFELTFKPDHLNWAKETLLMKQESHHKPRYIFVDLGANSADSLEAFLQHDNAKFQYEYPRPEWATYDQACELIPMSLLENTRLSLELIVDF